jgi:hypothetical protein
VSDVARHVARMLSRVTKVAEVNGQAVCSECDDFHDLCPYGCGQITEDHYGGPCSKCWETA